MNCKEFEKNIPLFLKGGMDYETTEEFDSHMESCASCKEELSIQFLISEGMKHLENGDAFDLDAELKRKIDKSRKSHARYRFLFGVFQWGATAVLFLFGCALIFLFG